MPLARRNGDSEETVMVDVTNVYSIDIDNEIVYVTVEDTIALEVPDGIRKRTSNSSQDGTENQP